MQFLDIPTLTSSPTKADTAIAILEYWVKGDYYPRPTYFPSLQAAIAIVENLSEQEMAEFSDYHPLDLVSEAKEVLSIAQERFEDEIIETQQTQASENKPMPLTQEQILGFLPHGSGINGDWQMNENRKYFLFVNYFHPINEHGMYDDYCDFTLKVSKANTRDFQLTFQGTKSQYLNRKYQLRDYLEETFAYALEQCDRHFNESLSESTFKPPVDSN